MQRTSHLITGAAALAAAVLLVPTPPARAARHHTTHAAARKPVPPTVASVRSTVLATIGGENITLADLESQINQYPPAERAQFQSPEARKNVLDRMIQERVWLKAARQSGYDRKPEVAAQIQSQTNSIILRGYFNEAVVGRAKPSDAEVEKFYAEHTADYTTPERIAWRHILVASEKDALRVRQRIAKGEDFEKVAKETSLDPVSKDAGGWLGYLTRGGVAPDSNAAYAPLSDAAFALTPKEVSQPIRSPRGWHLLRVDSHDSTTVRPLEGVRSSIEFKIQNERSQAVYNAMLDSLKKVYNVSVKADSARFAQLASGAGVTNAKDLFELAQQTQEPKTRLQLYQRVVRDYPASEYAPRAQFMLGFVNSEELHAYDTAEGAFKSLIAKYPKSDLVESAQWMLKNMRNPTAPDSTGAPGAVEEEREHEHPEKGKP